MQERRRFIRVKGLEKVKFKIKDSKDRPKPITVKDMSLIGINLYAEVRLEKGVMLELQLELPNDSNIMRLEGEVLWQLPSHNNRFATGIRFKNINEETKERLTNFISECSKRIDEVREFVRCDLGTDATCNFLDNPNQEFSAKTVDISRGGMKLATKIFVDKGTKLQMIFSLPKNNEKIQCEVKVVWARSENNDQGFAVGVIFTKLETQEKEKIEKFIENYCQANLEE